MADCTKHGAFVDFFDDTVYCYRAATYTKLFVPHVMKIIAVVGKTLLGLAIRIHAPVMSFDSEFKLCDCRISSLLTFFVVFFILVNMSLTSQWFSRLQEFPWERGRAFVACEVGQIEYFYRWEELEEPGSSAGPQQWIRSFCGGMRDPARCRALDYVCDAKYIKVSKDIKKMVRVTAPKEHKGEIAYLNGERFKYPSQSFYVQPVLINGKEVLIGDFEYLD
jgi:hypothetical protein